MPKETNPKPFRELTRALASYLQNTLRAMMGQHYSFDGIDWENVFRALDRVIDSPYIGSSRMAVRVLLGSMLEGESPPVVFRPQLMDTLLDIIHAFSAEVSFLDVQLIPNSRDDHIHPSVEVSALQYAFHRLLVVDRDYTAAVCLQHMCKEKHMVGIWIDSSVMEPVEPSM